MAVRVILPTSRKSRKTTKSYPSTGDQFCESRKTTKSVPSTGISWGNENFCLNLFQQSSVPCHADRWVNGGSNKEPLI